MERQQLAHALAEACTLEGTFVLRSGATATTYFDKYQFEADPVLLTAVCEHVAPMIPDEIDVLAGLELGGVPIAVQLSVLTGLPCALVRKERKSYGTARLSEGADVAGRQVLIVEDVVSTGGQVAVSAEGLRADGAVVTHALCVVDRRGDATSVLDDAGVELLAAFTSSELGALGRGPGAV